MGFLSLLQSSLYDAGEHWCSVSFPTGNLIPFSEVWSCS